VQYLTVCSPNYLHDAHCRLGLRVGADVICEKPLVINPWNIDPLRELEEETGHRIYTVLQLRVHPKLIELREKLLAERLTKPHDVVLTYITSRGSWYDVSWKGSPDKSGGIPTNIGIHFFDLLVWLFGGVQSQSVHLSQSRKMAGQIALERANVKWFLSVDSADLPFVPEPGGRATFRSITVDGTEIEFSEGFTDLHTVVYKGVLDGKGFGLDDVRPSIELAYKMRSAAIEAPGADAHPKLRG
jgi:UDP-N-acetyl-2-amino-2-deoxyglucuronate dehydrogenase